MEPTVTMFLLSWLFSAGMLLGSLLEVSTTIRYFRERLGNSDRIRSNDHPVYSIEEGTDV